MIATESEIDESSVDKNMQKSSARCLQSQTSEKSLSDNLLEEGESSPDRKQEWAVAKL